MNTKKRKKLFKKIFIGVNIFLVMLICIENIYLYKYLLSKHKVISNEEELPNSSIKIVSYNIRCWNLLDIGRRSWFYRADLVLENIKVEKPDILGLQEVTNMQYKYIKAHMENYDSIIIYRDSVPWSEGCPIFFNTRRLKLITSGTFWLSDTPEEQSKSWGAANYRICSYIIVQDKQTEEKMAIFNTHLDHQSEEARMNGIRLICEKISQLEEMTVILMGDFNAEQNSETYRYVMEYLDDTKYVSIESDEGNTFHNWGEKKTGGPIDYIMITSKSYGVRSYKINRRDYDKFFPSDHYPVCVELEYFAK